MHQGPALLSSCDFSLELSSFSNCWWILLWLQCDRENFFVVLRVTSSSDIKLLLELCEFTLGEGQVQYVVLHVAENIIQILFGKPIFTLNL